MDDASTPTEDGPQRAARSTAIVSVVACAVLLVASIGASALLHWVQREAGANSTRIQQRAWFQDAATASQGVSNVVAIPFVIVPSTDLPVIWTAYDNGRTYQRGIAQGKAGSMDVVTLAPWTLKPGTWLVISIAGIPQSLKAWVK